MSSVNNINFCPNCGAKVIPNAKFCIECGTSLIKKQNNDEKEKISKIEVKNYTKTEEKVNNTMNSQPWQNENSTTNKKINSHTSPKNNSSNISCPSCEKIMDITKKSSLFSKSIYYSCNYCNIIFKETKTGLKLTNEPENTRLRSKYHSKTFLLEEWHNIFSNNYTSQEIEYLTNLKLERLTKQECPVCNHDLALLKDNSRSTIPYLFCSGCGLLLKLHNNQFFTLENCVDIYSPLWKYEQKLLSLKDMKNILNANEIIPEKAIESTTVLTPEDEKRIRYLNIHEESKYVAKFDKSLSSGNPMLPRPTDTMILKKNEKPVYKMYGISLSEPRMVRTTTRGYGGVSVKISKNITLHSGRSGPTSESHEEIKEIDNGDLLITTKRIIFLGNKRTVNIDLNKIISLSTEATKLQVQRSNKQKPEYFGNIKTQEYIDIEDKHIPVDINPRIIKKLIMGLIENSQ